MIAMMSRAPIPIQPRNYLEVAQSGGRYKTISAAINALASMAPSSDNPVLIDIGPGVYDESIVLSSSYVSFRGNGAIWRPTNGPALLINEGVTHIDVQGLMFQQASNIWYPLVQFGTSAPPGNYSGLEGKWYTFRNCKFWSNVGPQIVNGAHEAHFQDCIHRGEWASDWNGDVLLCDGKEDSTNGKNWTALAGKTISGVAAPIWGCIHGTSTQQFVFTPSAGNTGDICYVAIPYASETVTSGSDVDYLCFHVTCDQAVAAGAFKLKICSATNGTGALATFDLPALAANKYYRLVIPLTTEQKTALQGVSIGSLVFSTTLVSGSAHTVKFDDVWLQKGRLGQHHLVVFSTEGSTTPQGAHMTWQNCLMEIVGYSQSARLSGHSAGIIHAVKQSIWDGGNTTAGNIVLCNNRILVRPPGSSGTNAPNHGFVASVGNGYQSRIVGNQIQVDISYAGNANLYPYQTMIAYDAGNSGIIDASGNNYAGSMDTISLEAGVSYYLNLDTLIKIPFYIGNISAADGEIPVLGGKVDGAGMRFTYPVRVRRIVLFGLGTGNLTGKVYVDGTVDNDLTKTLVGSGTYASAFGTARRVNRASNADIGVTLQADADFTNVSGYIEIDTHRNAL